MQNPPPPRCGQIDIYENITLPQTSFEFVVIIFTLNGMHIGCIRNSEY